MFAVVLAAMEIGLRLAGTRSPVLRAEMFEVRDDPLLPYVLRPGYRGLYGGGAVTIGAGGQREVPSATGEAQAALPPVALLGDSVAFGQGLDDDQTIAASMMRAPGWPPRVGVAVIAAPGYTSWNEYRALAGYPGLSSLRNVVLLYVENDRKLDNDLFRLAETEGRYLHGQDGWFHAATRALYDHSRLFYVASDAVRKAISLARAAAAPARADRLTIEDEAFAYSMEAVGRIRDLAAENGIDFRVALHRDFRVHIDPEWTAAYEAAVTAALGRLGVRHFVLSRPTDKLDIGRLPLSWNDRTHPSAEASRLIGEQIADELLAAGVLPSAEAAEAP
jgi:hypothetical protein